MWLREKSQIQYSEGHGHKIPDPNNPASITAAPPPAVPDASTQTTQIFTHTEPTTTLTTQAREHTDISVEGKSQKTDFSRAKNIAPTETEGLLL